MENNGNLLRQVRNLRLGLFLLALVNIFLLFTAFRDHYGKQSLEELNVERINIMGSNHKPVMVLSNNHLMPGPTINGKSYPRELADGRENLNGIIFFNQYGDEVGGLLYNGFQKDSGYSALEHFSFDQWKQNQVLALQYLDNGKSKRTGLRIYDRPNDVTLDKMFDRLKLRNEVDKNSRVYDSLVKEIAVAGQRGENGVERMFVGSLDDTAQIQLKDQDGKIRLKLYIDKMGNPRIDFLGSDGTVSKSITE